MELILLYKTFFFKSYVPHRLVLSRVSGGCTICPQPPHPENIAIFLLLHDTCISLKSINLSSHSKVHVYKTLQKRACFRSTCTHRKRDCALTQLNATIFQMSCLKLKFMFTDYIDRNYVPENVYNPFEQLSL